MLIGTNVAGEVFPPYF